MVVVVWWPLPPEELLDPPLVLVLVWPGEDWLWVRPGAERLPVCSPLFDWEAGVVVVAEEPPLPTCPPLPLPLTIVEPLPWPWVGAPPLDARVPGVPLLVERPDAEAPAAAAAPAVAVIPPDAAPATAEPAPEACSSFGWVRWGIALSAGGADAGPTSARPSGSALDGSSPSPATTSPTSHSRNTSATARPTHASTRARPWDRAARTAGRGPAGVP